MYVFFVFSSNYGRCLLNFFGGGLFQQPEKHSQMWKWDPKTSEDQGEELAQSLWISLCKRGCRGTSWPESILSYMKIKVCRGKARKGKNGDGGREGCLKLTL